MYYERDIRIEDWAYRKIVEDLKVGGAQEVRKGEYLGSQFYTVHHDSCTIDLAYWPRQKNLDLKIFEEGDKANEILKLLKKRIEDYNERYCDAEGL